MGFIRKNKQSDSDLPSEQIENSNEIFEDDEDDFSVVTKSSPVTRAEFHRSAEEHMLDAVEKTGSDIDVPLPDIDDTDDTTDTVDTADTDNTADTAVTTDNDGESTTENITENTTEKIGDETDNADNNSTSDPIPYEDNFMDDFSLNADDENRVMHDIDVPFAESTSEPKKKRQRISVAEFLAKHKKGLKSTGIAAASVVGVAAVIYIYGCATIGSSDVMGRNIAIENIDVSGLTFQQAYDKVSASPLLNGKNITVVSNGKTCTINGVEAGLTARVEDTVDRAMRYGKTGNVFIDGFANTLQLFFTHVVQPSADVNETELRRKLNDFGESIFGELVQHKLEIGEENIICTPGHTGFSGDTDAAYNEIITAINDEQYENIRITLNSAPPTDYTIEDLDAFVYANPQDACYIVENNDVTVSPEVWGRYLDKSVAEPLIGQLHEGGSIVNIPYHKIEPNVKSDELTQKLFNGTIADYSTTFVAGGNRGKNVAIAASKIDGKVLMPGEVFSFNDTVGSRSRANGFLEAPEYANGETVMGIGGGTCQVTTTLYNAVLYADLSIVSRLNHMFPVGYAPIGQDATVSDSGVDFKFANNMDYPIKISAVTNGGKLTVSIIGTIRDQQHVVKMENITTAAGNAGTDKSVRTYRYVYDTDGNLLRKDDMGKSYYMAH